MKKILLLHENTIMTISKDIFTPQAIISIMQEKIIIPDECSSIIYIKGRYQRIGTVLYRNGYYDALIDEAYNAQIKIIVNESIRNVLTHNQTYIFTGVTQKAISNGVIGYNIQITDSPIEQKNEMSDRDKKLLSLMEKKASLSTTKPSMVIEKVLIDGRIPSVVLVFPMQTETKTEFFKQLGIGGRSYTISEKSINFGNVSEFKKELCRLDGLFDVIIILRGGGAGIEFFSNLDVIETILMIKTPILLRQFVDEWKNNPTDTGNYLREIAERIYKQKSNSENIIREQLKKQVDEELNRHIADKDKIDKERVELQKELNTVLRDKVTIEKSVSIMKMRLYNLEQMLQRKESEIQRLKNKKSGCLSMVAVFIGIVILIAII